MTEWPVPEEGDPPRPRRRAPVVDERVKHPEDLAEAITSIAVLVERIERIEDARELQAIENLRRLKELNHAHEQARQKESDFLQTAIYTKSEGERFAWQRGVDDTLSQLKARRDNNLGLMAFGISVVSIALAAWRAFGGG